MRYNVRATVKNNSDAYEEFFTSVGRVYNSSSHPSHVKNSIPYSQFLRLRRLCSEESDRRGYPASVVQAGHHRVQQIDRQSELQTSQKENNNRIPFTLTFHPH